MYNILKELCEIADVKYEEINNDVKIHMYKNMVVVNDYKKLLNYNDENVLISVKNNRITIEGVDLKIKQLSKNELIICGQIGKVCFEK